MRTASGPPSHIITSLTREVNQQRLEEAEEAMSSDLTNSKMSPLALLARQSSSSSNTPELSPIRDILEFVNDSGSRSREADSDSSRGMFRLMLLFYLLFNRFLSVSLKL